jgi:hypothetical protein
MQVYDAVNAFIFILQSNIILKCAQVVSQVGAPSGTNTRKNASFFIHGYLIYIVHGPQGSPPYMAAFAFHDRFSVGSIYEPARELHLVRRGDLSGVWSKPAYHSL